MNDDIVIRIPQSVLRELLANHDHANDTVPVVYEEPTPGRPWTDRQKRFCYRLLQRLGHEDEEAKRYITLKLRLNGAPPSRQQASQLIDQLQAELAAKEEAGRGAA